MKSVKNEIQYQLSNKVMEQLCSKVEDYLHGYFLGQVYKHIVDRLWSEVWSKSLKS